MPLHMRANQYRGVNAHLHSALQRANEWESFHSDHVTHLREALQELLPLESGYIVKTERSLQIRQYNPVGDEIGRSRTKPDALIYSTASERTRPPLDSDGAAPALSLPLLATINELDYFTGIVIWRADDHSRFGTPVARLELLSPANKPGGAHHRQYLAKRDETLASGIKLVEIDYLHEQPTHLASLPSYVRRDAGAFPYLILLSNPAPSLAQGTTDVFGFRVDDPVPKIRVPLAGEDAVTVDFGAVYHHTFYEDFSYGMVLVDYAELPAGFDTYDDTDQARIRARMAAVAAQHPAE